MKIIWLLGLAVLLVATACSKFVPTLSQAAPVPVQPDTSPVPATLESTISLYVFLHHARPNNPDHAMRVATTCVE